MRRDDSSQKIRDSIEIAKCNVSIGHIIKTAVFTLGG